MQLNRIGTFVAALVAAATFDMISTSKPAAAVSLVGLAEDSTLVLFDSSNPTSTSSVQVTGINGTLLGIDRRPANNLIYGLTSTNNIYTINPFTGVATFVSTLSVPFTGGTVSGVDFNPVPDRLRVIGGNDQSFRINVDTGATIVDGSLNPGDPNVTAVAYTNADTNPATGTTLYDIDYISDALFIQNPPNNGTLVQVGSLGVDIDSTAGFDIFTSQGVNTAFAALTPASASGSNLYTINLRTGEATSLGAIGTNKRLIGLTTTVPEPSITLASFLGVSVLGLLGRYRRHLKLAK
ncbi:MAG TPA: DUF4394 domain-containing protein [Nostocaceae cyanobacterium]|nr:DUF4394 domain-containing protein [Nostocaceae cyanobacterium]